MEWVCDYERGGHREARMGNTVCMWMSCLGSDPSRKMARNSGGEHFIRASCANRKADEAPWLGKGWLKRMQRKPSCWGRLGNHSCTKDWYSRSNPGPWWTHFLTQQVQVDWRTEGRWWRIQGFDHTILATEVEYITQNARDGKQFRFFSDFCSICVCIMETISSTEPICVTRTLFIQPRSASGILNAAQNKISTWNSPWMHSVFGFWST